MFSRLPFATVFGLFLTIPGVVIAQDSPGGFWHRLDTNKDGSLDPAEIPPGMKVLVERSATKLGLDPTKPISIQQLQGGSPAAAQTSTPTTPGSSAGATAPAGSNTPATPSAQGAPAAASAGSPSSHKSRRFLTAAERLPKGLPSWFTEGDKNRDGQVMMHEFAKTWTESKAKEFATHDQNDDGVITAKEAVAPPKSAERDSDRDRPRRSRRND